MTGIVKNGLLVLAVFAVCQYVFAVSGIKSKSGEDKGKAINNAVAFSNIKSTVTFSIKDNYLSRNRSINIKTQEQFKLQNSIVSFKKGNVVYILPYKSQNGVKLPAFICTSPSQSITR